MVQVRANLLDSEMALAVTSALFSFDVPGPPVGKKRHKNGQAFGGGMIHYTDQKTVNYEGMVKWVAKQAGVRMLEGPLWMHITAFAPLPKSASKALRELTARGNAYFTTKPDWDNVGKIIGDALNGVAWRDDSQVADGRVIKRYTLDNPRVVVSIGVLDGDVAPCHTARP